ncbi:MAG: hypothetical protein WEB00_00755 [Dehalococcoidia bacterium]
MQSTTTRPGVYIDRETCRLIRVAEGNELEGREGNWEFLHEDPNMGLLGSREVAVEKGFATDDKAIDWYRFEEDAIEQVDEVLEDMNKQQAKAEAAAEAEHERNSTPMAY